MKQSSYRFSLESIDLTVSVQSELDHHFSKDYGHVFKERFDEAPPDIFLRIGLFQEDASDISKRSHNCVELCSSSASLLHWERQIRWKLTNIISSKLYREMNLIRFHGSFVVLGDKSIFITGPSGSGKSTMISYLTQLKGFDYFGHEMCYIGSERMFGWPQPITINEDSKRYLSRVGALDTMQFLGMSSAGKWSYQPKIGGSVQSFLKPDLIVFPQNVLLKGDQGVYDMREDLVFARLSREVEPPMTGVSTPEKDLNEYMASSWNICRYLSSVKGVMALWNDDQGRVVDNIVKCL